MDPTVQEWLPTAVFAALWLFTALVTVLIVRGLCRLAGRLVTSSRAFGEDPSDRMFGFIVAGMLVWRVVPWFGWAFVRVAWFVGRDLPLALSRAFEASTFECSKDAVAICRRTLTMSFTSYWTGSIADLLRSFDSVPYLSILFFLLLWALAAQLFGAFRSGDNATFGPLARPLLGMTAVARQNALFFLVLGVATYLSIAAIAAVPGLTAEEKLSESSKPQRLEESLKSASMAKADLGPVANEPFKVAFKAIETAQSTNVVAPAAATPTEAAAPPAPAAAVAPLKSEEREEMLATLTSRLNEAVALRTRAVGQLAEAAASLQKSVESARGDAVTLYEQNLDVRKGSRERATHFASLVAWFRAGNLRAEATLRKCRQSIGVGDVEAINWSSRVEGLLRKGSFPRWWDDAAYGAGMRQIFESYYTASVQCDAGFAFGDIPERPPLGGTLGPFGLVARWLLETESLPLALIVGLIGFGLLGSACSTFVREQAGRPRAGGTALVDDLGGIVIRGVSAAIVVFLAVEGGLTIFAAGTTEPNPYVLLLTCLVAAVFSEHVWEAVRKKLTDSLGAELTKPADQAPSAKTPPAPPGGAVVPS